jgi:hypothetical protein
MAVAGAFNSYTGKFRMAGALVVLTGLTTGAAKVQNAVRPRD